MAETETIGARIKRLRLAQQIKSKDLAVKAGMHPSSLSQIESGRRVPETATLQRLAQALGKNKASELMDGTTAKAKPDPAERSSAQPPDTAAVVVEPADIPKLVSAAVNAALADFAATIAAALGSWHAAHLSGEIQQPVRGTQGVSGATRR